MIMALVGQNFMLVQVHMKFNPYQYLAQKIVAAVLANLVWGEIIILGLNLHAIYCVSKEETGVTFHNADQSNQFAAEASLLSISSAEHHNPSLRW